MKSSCFYYGVISPDGYRGLIPLSDNETNIIVDGQSPAVKQELFDFVRTELECRHIPCDYFFTADRISGLHFNGILIADSDFTVPDRHETIRISLPDFQNSEINGQSDKIQNILLQKEKQLLRCERFIAACNSIRNDIFRLESPYINRTKINRFTLRLWQRITNGMKGHIGSEEKHYVTCLTAEGSELNMEAFDAYCERILVINDRTGSCAGLIADRLRRYALGSGYDVISCPCSADSDIIEHLIIPELSFGVFTSKPFHRADFENCRSIYSKRFLYPQVKNIKRRIDFSLKAYRKLMNEAFVSLEKINELDRQLDVIYYKNTDISALKDKVGLIFANNML